MLSAAVLMAILGGVLFVAPWWAAVVLAGVAAAVAAAELAGLSAAAGAPVSRPVAVTATAAVCVATALGGGSIHGGPMLQVLLAVIVGIGVVTLGSGAPSPSGITRAATLFMAPLYVGVPVGLLAWIRVVHGPEVLVWLVAVIAVSDSAQYAGGRLFGRTRLAPAVSPAKTREGSATGVAAAAVAGAVLAGWGLRGEAAAVAALMAIVLAIVGIAGDLFESFLKRSVGVKDASHLIPGHGGVLDRIDAYLFAAPVFVLLLGYLG